MHEFFSLYICPLYCFYKNFIRSCIYLFLTVLGLCYCTRAFSSRSERVYCAAVLRLFVAVASLAVEHRL